MEKKKLSKTAVFLIVTANRKWQEEHTGWPGWRRLVWRRSSRQKEILLKTDLPLNKAGKKQARALAEKAWNELRLKERLDEFGQHGRLTFSNPRLKIVEALVFTKENAK